MAKNSGERILVADDDAASRKLLTRILTRAGFTCTEAPDGIEALKQLHDDAPSFAERNLDHRAGVVGCDFQPETPDQF